MWEYQIKLIGFETYSELIDVLNKEGQLGWEIVSYTEEEILRSGFNRKAKVLFKRKIENSAIVDDAV